MSQLILAAVLAAALAAQGAPLTVRDLDGTSSTPLAPAAGEINLVIFVSADCPISARYSPEINRIVHEYAARGVHAWLVYADAKADPAAVRANLREFHAGVSATTMIDTGFRLTTSVDATVTPEAVVYTHTGRVYRGRIDDLYEAIGQNRQTAAHHDLRDALDAVLAGKPVATAETKPVGCFIERTNK
jgi:hypothetical protein